MAARLDVVGGTELAEDPLDRCPSPEVCCMPWPSLRDVSAERLPARRRANAALLVWITLILLGASFWS